MLRWAIEDPIHPLLVWILVCLVIAAWLLAMAARWAL